LLTPSRWKSFLQSSTEEAKQGQPHFPLEPGNAFCVEAVEFKDGEKMGAQGRSWTDDETERLRSHILQGGSAVRASVMFRRTMTAVRQQACKMGLPFPSVLQTRKRLTAATAVEESSQLRSSRRS
jgi:hypothetical protein